MDKRILTWDKAGARWKKIYRGRVWYGERGARKTDKSAYQQAVNAFHEWKTTADTDIDAHRPHADQYRQAIAQRQAMVNWLLLERDNQEQYDQRIERLKNPRNAYERVTAVDWGNPLTYSHEHDGLVREIDHLKTDFARLNPPELDTPETLNVSPIANRPLLERDFWIQNVKALQSHNRWIGVTDHAKTIGANLDDFLAVKKRQADSGQIAYGWSSVMRYHLEYFRRYAGEMAVENANANLLSGYHGHLLDTIRAGTITTTYAKGLLATLKTFVRWLWESEVIEQLPRNLGTLRITADIPTIKTLTTGEIKTLLTEATERTRLFILLMLNTGMTGKDISDLIPNEVEWTIGRVTRKRSKTKREKNVPVVSYRLWQATFDLLKQYGSRKGERVFHNKTGQPLRRWSEKDNGKPRNVDNVRGVWAKLTERTGIRKPLKLLRTTSASTLAKHMEYGRFAFLFLGHSPKTTAERHYVQVPQDLFDKAILWLGKELGIE
jgi:integrase